ncbi:MAG: transporter substrate-binding domain-containing protein [Nitriliruptor sp.]|uniref:transporter substrate-binding domain-containing protein n=1 Tax=Nitriliruptor sp. TaxID=2448056 RepID=UPI00349FF7EB
MRLTTRRASALLAALALTATACGGGDDPEPDTTEDGAESTDDGGDGEAAADFTLLTEGTLSICSDLPYEPFEFEDPDSPSGFSGFDIDLMQAIADDLGLDGIEVRATTFDTIENGTALATDQCDVAASAMTINDEREENLDFTDSYYESLQSLLVNADSDIASLEDTDGKRIGVQVSTTGQTYAEENAPEGAELVEFQNTGDLFAALVSGSVDAILQDQPVNAERARTDDSVELVEEYDTGESYGFAVANEREDGLLDALNDGLQTLRDDGRYDEIYDEYFAAE